MLQTNDLCGVFVPVVAPFLPNGALDLASFRRYVAGLLAFDIQGIVVNGTTGECPTVAWEEAAALVRAAQEVAAAQKRPVPIVVGTGTNDTAASVRRTELAGRLGANAALVVTPYYSRPSQEGIEAHYRRIAEVGVPVIAYEIPARTGVRLTADTMRRILELDGVIGVKDSSGSTALLEELMRHKTKPVLCGDDALLCDMLRLGARGGILASANVRTPLFLETCRLAATGDMAAAEQAFAPLRPIIERLFREPNPAPLKWLLARHGMIAEGAVRLPLAPISPALARELEQEPVN
ncbi:4-hydroxy-tetrahydrodipicolinate synthase [Paenibacillus cymbidii]|uniref:4-hydroxy-tetrahydrodipicolinate synthase n=1 Tax=Paenibacillus cymbidii TaxID=1639034 RepID=UPI001080AAB1|nr:4-hydroxy-tetrahydrodipicolinate synthase [Paenibacillus cymbidii]